MSQPQMEVEVNALPFHISLERALNGLGHDRLFHTSEPNMGFKALLYLIGIAEIPLGHEIILNAMHFAMNRCAEIDEPLLALYDAAIINLHSEKYLAVGRAQDKNADEQRRLNELEAARLQNERIAADFKDLDRTRTDLQLRTATIAQIEADLRRRDAALAKREARLRKRAKKR